MKNYRYVLSVFMIILFTLLFFSSCVAKDPVLDVVISELKTELQTNYSEDMSMVKHMTIFENMLKVYMTDDYPSERLNKFARAVTRAYGPAMRRNKKLHQIFKVTIFQKKLIDNKMVLKPIAECQYENASDRIEVELLGLGSGKYDIKD